VTIGGVGYQAKPGERVVSVTITTWARAGVVVVYDVNVTDLGYSGDADGVQYVVREVPK